MADETHRCSRRFREPAAGHGPAQSKDGSFLSQFVAYFQDSSHQSRRGSVSSASKMSMAS
jgi:hypothetical protein